MARSALYRVSSYTICVNLPEEPDCALLVHGYTGAMDRVNKDVAQLMKSRAVFSEAMFDHLPCSKETIHTLMKRGYLTSRSPVEEREYVHNMANFLHHTSSRGTASFLFLVAYDCNFRCPYCFENDISEHGKGWSKQVFTEEMVDRAYRAMGEIQPNRAMHSKSITLYGGEPLLAKNKAIVRYIVDEGLKRDYVFSAITNGYDLHHFTDLLGPKKIKRLQITLDGEAENHNRKRPHYRAGDSFDAIMKNVALALSLDVQVSMRINTDYDNVDILPALFDLFKQKGFTDYPHFSAYSALVHQVEEGLSCSATMSGKKTPGDYGQTTPLMSIEAPSDSAEAVASVISFSERETRGHETFDPGALDDAASEMVDEEQYINVEREEEIFSKYQTGMRPMDIQPIEWASNRPENGEVSIMPRRAFTRKYYQFAKENPDLMHRISCQDYGIRQTFKKAFEGKGLLSFKPVFCGAQTSMLIFDPYGDLYTCWEMVGMDRYKVGSYLGRVQFDDDRLAEWYDRNISNVPSCSKCKYAFFCGGGCAAHAYVKNDGDVKTSYCDEYPKVFHTVVPEIFEEHKRHTSQRERV